MMRKILVTHPWMGRGGSEATAMWILQALQEDFELTFVTASPLDWEELNGAYGTSVDPGKIRCRRAPRLPTVDSPLRLVHAQLRFFERFCHRIAGEFDLCLSTYNPVDFGRPGIQVIGDFSFCEEMRKRLYIHGEDRFVHRETLLRKIYLRAGKLLGIRERPLRERGDLVLANSEWSAEQLREFFGLGDVPVLYPPVILPRAPADAERDPLAFVCLGRVVPEKEIGRIVTILERVRKAGFPVTLQLIGALDDSPYSRRVAEQTAGKDWIVQHGFLALEEKQALLASCRFALHACRIEAFGIAVAEMASMGCVPFVPDTGGAGEIVPHPELHFGDEDEAVEKILSLLRDPLRAGEIAGELPAAMDRFGPDVFMRELRSFVLKFAGLPEASEDTDVDPEKDLAALG